MGIRQFGTITPAGAGRSPAHRVGAPEPQATRPAGQQGLLTAGIAAPGRIADPRAQARTLARASGDRLARAGAALLQLQRHYGNRYVQQVINSARQTTSPPAVPSLQAKLVVGPADDDHEREADRVAGQAARLPAAPRQQHEDNDTSGVRARPNPQHPRARAAGVPGDLKRAMPAAGAPGRSLPASVKEELETALGADFGAVRVHTGDQAAQLSRGLQAQAFTHGPDVFFGAGRYAPGTAAGKRLLAHELTHVVQQGGAPPKRDPAPHGRSTTPVVRTPRGDAAPGGSAARIQRKLSWRGTEWNQARSAWASKGGSVGVVFVTDKSKDDPVVVKTGEEAPAEVVLAANLHRRREGGKWRAKAPGVRTVPPGEGQQIKQEVGKRVLGEGRSEWDTGKDRAVKIIRNADQAGTVVFEYARGKGFDVLLEQMKKPLRAEDFPVSLFKNKGFVTSLGRFTAIDMFTGNYDRLAGGFNAENFKIRWSKEKILLIDNVLAGERASAFKSKSDDAFKVWTEKALTQWLKEGNFENIADMILRNINNGISMTAGITEPGQVKAIGDALKTTRDSWMLGLEQGREWLRTAAGDLGQLTEGIAPEDVGEVQASIMKRMHFLFPDLFGAELERREKELERQELEHQEAITTPSARKRAVGRGQQERERRLRKPLIMGAFEIDPERKRITVLEISRADNTAHIQVLPDGFTGDVALDQLEDAIERQPV